jgi:hypothetical protein
MLFFFSLLFLEFHSIISVLLDHLASKVCICGGYSYSDINYTAHHLVLRRIDLKEHPADFEHTCISLAHLDINLAISHVELLLYSGRVPLTSLYLRLTVRRVCGSDPTRDEISIHVKYRSI